MILIVPLSLQRSQTVDDTGHKLADLCIYEWITSTPIAALALEYKGVIHSNDVDFLRFPGLKTENPLKA
jgi:hypothetical protein